MSTGVLYASSEPFGVVMLIKSVPMRVDDLSYTYNQRNINFPSTLLVSSLLNALTLIIFVSGFELVLASFKAEAIS